MEINITGRHTHVSDSMKKYALEKLGKLEYHNDMVTRADVVMNIENDQRHMVEVIAHSKVGGHVVAKAEHTDMYAAIDLLLDKMEHQLTKQKEKVKVERKHVRTKASGAEPAGRRKTSASGKNRAQKPEGAAGPAGAAGATGAETESEI